MKDKIRKLQNHFNNGLKEGIQAKVHYFVGDRVHLKGTNVNGTQLHVNQKNKKCYMTLFDVVKEIKYQHKEKKRGKEYHNFYLDVMRNKNAEN